jgi:2,3-bisphosphoglycerate-independent phosphoglycerate mutase
MKICFVVIDGMNDLPIKELSQKTPLEVAKTKWIDILASNGVYGKIKFFDFAPESDEAMMKLLGLNPEKNYPGRGVFEALGSNMKLEKVALYFRANIVKVEEGKIKDFEPEINEKQKKEIEKNVKSIKLKVPFIFKLTKDYRGVLILKGNLSDCISNTNPSYKRVGNLSMAVKKSPYIKRCLPLKNTKKAKLTAEIVNDFTKKTLETLKKFNLAIVLRGASKVGEWKKRIENRYKGWIVISDMPVERGIGKIIGMKIMDYEKDYKKLAEKVSKAIERENVYLQIKGPDYYSHKGDYLKKIKAIEKIDREFFSYLIKNLMGKDIWLIVACDHITSTKHKRHYKGNPTFIKVNLKNLKMKKTLKFSEKICKKTVEPDFLLFNYYA